MSSSDSETASRYTPKRREQYQPLGPDETDKLPALAAAIATVGTTAVTLSNVKVVKTELAPTV